MTPCEPEELDYGCCLPLISCSASDIEGETDFLNSTPFVHVCIVTWHITRSVELDDLGDQVEPDPAGLVLALHGLREQFTVSLLDPDSHVVRRFYLLEDLARRAPRNWWTLQKQVYENFS